MGRPGRQRGWVGSRAAASWVLRPNDHAMETVTCAPHAGAVRRLRAFFQVKVGTQGAAVEAARPPEWRPVSPARNARGWGATGGGLGVLVVGGAFVQYAQPLASGSRPSWSRSTRADSRRDSRWGRSRTLTTRPQRRRRAGSGGADLCAGAGLCRKNPGLTPARPGVHSADMTEPAAEAPSGNRWNSAVLHRHAVPIRG